MRGRTLPAACFAAVSAALLATGCGSSHGVQVPKQPEAFHHGAELFNQRCAGCHSLDVANTQGSKPTGQVSGGERTNGPNFNVRKENREDVLYAIRNGGFSGAIMPANVVMGRDAQDVALFLERYAGSKSTSQAQNAAPNNK